jgi:hypothetical protein
MTAVGIAQDFEQYSEITSFTLNRFIMTTVISLGFLPAAANYIWSLQSSMSRDQRRHYFITMMIFMLGKTHTKIPMVRIFDTPRDGATNFGAQN